MQFFANNAIFGLDSLRRGYVCKLRRNPAGPVFVLYVRLGLFCKLLCRALKAGRVPGALRGRTRGLTYASFFHL